MHIFGNLSSKFSKVNVRFEISTFKVVYMRNFIKIEKLILFSSNYPNLGIWLQIFKKLCQICNQHRQNKVQANFVKRLESWYFLAENIQICSFGLKFWTTKATRKFRISPILKLCVVSQFFGLFQQFLGRFGWFWHVSACSGFKQVQNLLHICRTPFYKNTSGGLLEVVRTELSLPIKFCVWIFL